MLNTRQQKALHILAAGNIHIVNRGARIFSVPSQQKNHLPYRVNLTAQTCECYDAKSHKCKHIRAAELREKELAPVAIQAKPIPRTYAQLFQSLGLTA